MDLMKNRSKRRLNFILSGRSVDRLGRLREITDAGSNTAVLKDSLLVYEKLVEALSNGDRLYIKDCRGNLRPWDLIVDVDSSPERSSVVPTTA